MILVCPLTCIMAAVPSILCSTWHLDMTLGNGVSVKLEDLQI